MNDYMGMGEESGVIESPQVITPPAETPSAPEPSTEPAPAPEPAPAAEAPKETPEPATPQTEPTPEVKEKIVEKIIEKYPEFKDETAKELYERFVNGDTDGIYNYLSEIKKDYNTMSDMDVVRAGLAQKNPQWSPEDVELEIRSEYGRELEKYDLSVIDKDLNPDEYKEAVAHNNQVEANLLKLQRDARDHRIALKEKQKTIELPKIAQPAQEQQPAAPTQEQVDELKRQWAEAAAKEVPAIGDFKFQVGDGKSNEEVTYAITPDEKGALVENMKNWNGDDWMRSRKWLNDDGTANFLKIAEDVHTLEKLPSIIKSIYTQARNKTTKDVVADIKNIDLENTRNAVTEPPTGDPAASYWD